MQAVWVAAYDPGVRTRLRPAARLVVGAALLATLGGGGVASAEGATLDDVVAALRTVVDDPSWQTKSRTLERDAFAGITQTIPLDAAALAPMKGARSLEAIAPGRDAWYAAYVLEFEGAAGAPALLSAMRTAIEGLASRVPPGSTLEIADGAGVGPGGWRLEATHGREGASSAMQGRAFARDRFAVLLLCAVRSGPPHLEVTSGQQPVLPLPLGPTPAARIRAWLEANVVVSTTTLTP